MITTYASFFYLTLCYKDNGQN